MKYIIASLETTELFRCFLHQVVEGPVAAGCHALTAQLQTQSSSIPASKTLLISEARYIFVLVKLRFSAENLIVEKNSSG